MSIERRESDRIDTPGGHLRARNQITEQSLGELANISDTGFMLVSEQQFEMGAVLQVSLEGETLETPLVVGATCLWGSEAGGAGCYWYGFQIIDISPSNQQRLDVLIGTLG